MNALLGLWEFLVGDDWRTGVGVVIALGLTTLVAAAGANAWWVMPPSVLLLLGVSVWRVWRAARPRA